MHNLWDIVSMQCRLFQCSWEHLCVGCALSLFAVAVKVAVHIYIIFVYYCRINANYFWSSGNVFTQWSIFSFYQGIYEYLASIYKDLFLDCTFCTKFLMTNQVKGEKPSPLQQIACSRHFHSCFKILSLWQQLISHICQDLFIVAPAAIMFLRSFPCSKSFKP